MSGANTGDGLTTAVTTAVATIGLDVGATAIKGAVVGVDGTITARRQVPTPSAGTTTEIEDAIVACLDLLRQDADPVGAVGLAAAGWIGPDRRSVVFSANFPAWSHEPLVDRVEQRSGLPVVLENDANAAAWGEFRFGAAAGATSMVAITLGSGVGGAVIVNGALLRGHRGAAGEFGHAVMITDGYPCSCGRRGCLENYLSGRSVNRRAAETVGTDLQHSDLLTLAGAGDERALAAYRELGQLLGLGLADVVMTVDPEVVVVSGGVAAAYDFFVGDARTAMAAELGPHWSALVPAFTVGVLGQDAGTLGAADLARQTT